MRITHTLSLNSIGKRYILVGFVNVDARSNWITYWRRFGMFARCLRTVTSSSKTAPVPQQQQQQQLHIGGVGERERQSGSGSGSAATLSCQWLPWVYGYELSIIVQEPFTKAHRSSHSLALACVFVVTLGALLLALVSVVALCLTGGDTDTDTGEEGAHACFGASRAAGRCSYDSRSSGSSSSSSGSSCRSCSRTPFVDNECSGKSTQSFGRYSLCGVGVGVVSGSSQVACKGGKVI
jgi:hypothetical protein